jgi:hypothetical protein
MRCRLQRQPRTLAWPGDLVTFCAAGATSNRDSIVYLLQVTVR